jgi:hypothetical protein
MDHTAQLRVLCRNGTDESTPESIGNALVWIPRLVRAMESLAMLAGKSLQITELRLSEAFHFIEDAVWKLEVNLAPKNVRKGFLKIDAAIKRRKQKVPIANNHVWRMHSETAFVETDRQFELLRSLDPDHGRAM